MEMSTLFVALIFSALSTFAQTSPRWTPQTLNGKISQHDGPNCYNGALASAGYIDELVQTDSSEYRFFLEFFCKKNSKQSNGGIQLLAFEYGDQGLDHGALILSPKKIFEKTSISGLQGRYVEDRKEASVYAIKNLKDSVYYKDSLVPDSVLRIESYSCEAPSVVRPQVELISQNHVAKLTRKLNQRLESEVTFQKAFPDLTTFNNDLIQLTREVDQLETSPIEAIYTLSQVNGILSYLYNLSAEISPGDDNIDLSFKDARTKLNEATTRSFNKYKGQTTDPRLLKVIEELE